MSNLQTSQSALISSFRVEPTAGKDATSPGQQQDTAAQQPFVPNYNFHQQPYPHYAPAVNDVKGENVDQTHEHISFFQSYPPPPQQQQLQQPQLYENQQATTSSPDAEKQKAYYRRHSWASSKKDDDGLYSPSSNESSNEMYDTESNRAQMQVIFDKKRRRRESHNAVERRRRDNINERIQELLTLLPESSLDPVNKPHKGFILRKSVDYIRNLQQDLTRFQHRVQELEATLEHYKIKQQMASNEPSLAYGLMSPPTQAIDTTMRNSYQQVYIQPPQSPRHNQQLLRSFETSATQPTVLKWDH
jgi:hypothetical protein